MTRYHYYIGTRTKWGAYVDTWWDIESVLIGRYGGFSRYAVDGAWRPEDGSPVVKEESRVYECLGTDPTPAETAAILRDLANQTCVLYTVEKVQGGFV